MQQLLLVMVAILLAGICLATWAQRRRLQGTALFSAWGWGLAAEFAWLASCVAQATIPKNSALLDQFWLWSAVLALCPLISVLGSRRPTDRVWNLFIILPLIAVLGWPAIAAAGYSRHLVPVRLQAPALMGFGLVLIMGAGNFLGTRFTGPVCLAAVAIAGSLSPLLSAWHLDPSTTTICRAASGVLLAAALWWAWQRGRQPTNAASPFDRLWQDFRDTFGMVWSLRIQDRINAAAQQEGWSCRIGPDGLQWQTEISPAERERSSDRLEQTTRWLLRRFVDPPWIDERLNSVPITREGR